MQSHPSPEPAAATQVQDFYERYPYPGPVDSLDAYRQLWADPQRRRADHHLFQPGQPYREDAAILVAGCGTSQAAKHAVRWPAARVTGIDFSATSVRCTGELKRKHKLHKLELRQLPIERAGELGTQFDQIVCTGVLHHLADPDASLQALRGQRLRRSPARDLNRPGLYGRLPHLNHARAARGRRMARHAEGMRRLASIPVVRRQPRDSPAGGGIKVPFPARWGGRSL